MICDVTAGAWGKKLMPYPINQIWREQIELNWCARWLMGYGIKISFPRLPQWRHRSPGSNSIDSASTLTRLIQKHHVLGCCDLLSIFKCFGPQRLETLIRTPNFSTLIQVNRSGIKDEKTEVSDILQKLPSRKFPSNGCKVSKQILRKHWSV